MQSDLDLHCLFKPFFGRQLAFEILIFYLHKGLLIGFLVSVFISFRTVYGRAEKALVRRHGCICAVSPELSLLTNMQLVSASHDLYIDLHIPNISRPVSCVLCEKVICIYV